MLWVVGFMTNPTATAINYSLILFTYDKVPN